VAAGLGGRRQFTEFSETGDYQVKILLPTNMVATMAAARTFLVSNGASVVQNLGFGVELLSKASSTEVSTATPATPSALAGIDGAFTDPSFRTRSALRRPMRGSLG
jgi:hypothetical protein